MVAPRSISIEEGFRLLQLETEEVRSGFKRLEQLARISEQTNLVNSMSYTADKTNGEVLSNAKLESDT